MYGRARLPRDRYPYPKSPSSRPLSVNIPAGRYVFVVDVETVIHVAPDGLHMYPKVLGNTYPARYAGELFIDQPGNVDEVTNLSGTFQFKNRRALCCVAAGLRLLGFTVGDVVWFPPDGSYPVVLACE